MARLFAVSSEVSWGESFQQKSWNADISRKCTLHPLSCQGAEHNGQQHLPLEFLPSVVCTTEARILSMPNTSCTITLPKAICNLTTHKGLLSGCDALHVGLALKCYHILHGFHKSQSK